MEVEMPQGVADVEDEDEDRHSGHVGRQGDAYGVPVELEDDQRLSNCDR